MSSIFLIASVLVLSVLGHSTGMATASTGWDDQDFFRHCPPSRCSKDGPEVRFPLRLETSSSSSSCGATCAKLTCSGQDVILLHPLLGPCKVIAIDYSCATLIIIPLVDSLSPSPLQKLTSTNLPDDAYLRCPLYQATPYPDFCHYFPVCGLLVTLTITRESMADGFAGAPGQSRRWWSSGNTPRN